MSDQISSAEPAALYRYADLGRRWSDRLGDGTTRLARTLAAFAASCDGAPPIPSDLLERLRRHLDELGAEDAWVRQVGRDFERAGAGVTAGVASLGLSSLVAGVASDSGLAGDVGVLEPVPPAGTAGAVPGGTPQATQSGALVGTLGGGRGRSAAVVADAAPPPDDGPDQPDDVPFAGESATLWKQSDPSGTFLLQIAGDLVRALRGEPWLCLPQGPVPAPAGTATSPGAGAAPVEAISDVHFTATQQGDQLVGEIAVCWHDGQRHSWEPAPLQLQFSADGSQLTGSWRDTGRNQDIAVSLTRDEPDPPSAANFGLPANNLAIYGYGVKQAVRADGTVASVTEDYVEDPIADVNVVRHRGLDFSSRDDNWVVRSLPFCAPVGGTIYVYPNSPWNTIGLRLPSGDWLQFLHASATHVQTGQQVRAGDVLGMTGARGATTINLHVQAKDAQGNVLDPADVLAHVGAAPPVASGVG
jgi:hypothetical protein